MKYKVTAKKNGTVIDTKELYFTDYVNDILQADYPHILAPLSNTATQGCMLFDDTIEKTPKGYDYYSDKYIGGAKYNNGTWTIKNVKGHIGTVSFGFGSMVDGYYTITNARDTVINGFSNINNDEQCIWVDDDYILSTYFLYNYVGDVPFYKRKRNKIKHGLNGYKYAELSKSNSEIISTTFIEAGVLNHIWKGSDIKNDVYNKSSKVYGSFNGFSMCASKDKLIFINFYKYNYIPQSLYTGTNASATFASNTNCECHSLLELTIVNPDTLLREKVIINDIDGDISSYIPAGTYNLNTDAGTMRSNGDIIQMRAAACDDEYLYVYCYVQGSGNTIYGIKLDTIGTDAVEFTHFANLTSKNIHIINMKNKVYTNNLLGYDRAIYGLNHSENKAVLNGTGLYKAGITAFADFDFNLTTSDTLLITVEAVE